MPPQTLKAIFPAVCPSASPEISEQTKQIVHYLFAIMPVKQDTDVYPILHRIVGPNYNVASTEILKLAVYLLSNKLIHYNGRDRLVCDELLKWFQMGDNYLFLKAILSHKLPTIEAFAEGIFISAIRFKDRHMVEIFLDSGISPNILGFCMETYFFYTALQFATQSGSFGLVELLLNRGADLDMTTERRPYTDTPVQIAAQAGNLKIVELLLSRGTATNDCHWRESSALQTAVIAGNTQLVQMLLDRGADINTTQNEKYGCPLECAIRTRAISLIEMLLNRGADIDYRARPGANTPLQSAAMVENVEMVQHLLQLGANTNAPAPRRYSKDQEVGASRTALQWAAENGNFQLCQVLVKAGADPNAAPAISDSRRYVYVTTSLAAAVSSNNHQVVELLLKHGAEVNDKRGTRTALETAAKLNNTAITQLLLWAKADPKADDSIILAVKNRSIELISMLLQAGADINKIGLKGRNALSAAAKTNDSNLVKYLLGLGANPNPNEPESEPSAVPLVEAARLGNLEMIEILLHAGADCNQPENSTKPGRDVNLNALQLAAAKGNIDVVRRLLFAGADLNFPATRDGLTALQAAVISKNLELVQLLIDQGANPNSPGAGVFGVTALEAAVTNRNTRLVQILLAAGAEGSTSLQRAARNGDDDLICLLLDNGADVNWPAPGYQELNALQAAAYYGHYQTMQLLLANGADINAPACGIYGITALQAAAEGGYLHIAEFLLENGASVNAPRSRNGGTALEAAASRGRIDMLKLLLNAGADISPDLGRSQLKRALQLATKMGHDAAAKFLKYHQIC